MKYLETPCPICGSMLTYHYRTEIRCSTCIAAQRLREKEELKAARYSIYLRDEFKCVYCGSSPIEDNVKLVLDHVIPHIKTQDNTMYNLVTCCDECNRVKGANLLPLEIYERVIQRTIQRNKGISPEKQEQINKIMNEYFTQRK
jgi:CRISPR/Cas system Type II protein with McrA/HNH and RuvC-like nuclease domain